jgi:membrane protein implicated in regulation of membrane protease activity
MQDWIVWIIIILLAIIIGNQTRERQERETKGMTKKQKEEYFNNIKKK